MPRNGVVLFCSCDGSVVDLVTGNTAITSGTITYAAGRYAGSQSVDVSNAGNIPILLPKPPNFTVSSTVMFWCKAKYSYSGIKGIWGDVTSYIQNTTYFYTNSNIDYANTWYIKPTSGGSYCSNSYGISLPDLSLAWTHLAFSWDKGCYSMYVNGVLFWTNNGPTSWLKQDSNIIFGSHDGVAGHVFPGYLSHISVYSVALSGKEIMNAANSSISYSANTVFKSQYRTPC